MIWKTGFEEFFKPYTSARFQRRKAKSWPRPGSRLEGIEKIWKKNHGTPWRNTHHEFVNAIYCMSNKNGANSGICVNIYVYIECKTCSWLTLGIPIHYQTANDDLWCPTVAASPRWNCIGHLGIVSNTSSKWTTRPERFVGMVLSNLWLTHTQKRILGIHNGYSKY